MKRRYLAGLAKLGFYLRLILHVPLYYAVKRSLFTSPFHYIRFLRCALQLLLLFRHNKVVCTDQGYKLHLYFPAYPSRAFFYALESKLLRKPPAPTTVVFSMTKACSYHCPHCYQRHDQGADLPEDILLNTARTILDNGTSLFDIEGGEPLLRLPRLLALMNALDDRAECWINSTGDRFTETTLAQLKAAGLYGVMVSVHAPDAVQHDAFTGTEGSFDTACRFLRACRKHGLATAINCVLPDSPTLGNKLDRIMQLSRELDCDYVQLIHPKPSGNWLSDADDATRFSDDALRFIRQQHVVYNSATKPNHPSLSAQVFEESEDVLGCTAGGVDRFYVNAHGEVQPCEFLNLTFGNVQQEPFDCIFARMRSCFPTPCTTWLCCSLAQSINKALQQTEDNALPLSREQTEHLAGSMVRGSRTPIYTRLGIYDRD
jgi:MoaA/NifB/PqqE/SkfB family radical SAM enzyme